MNGEKFCPNCGTKTPDHAAFCPNCGGAFPKKTEAAPQQQYTPAPQQQYAPAPIVADYSGIVREQPADENKVLGILGAAIFALGGGLAHFGFYQLDLVSWISGFLTFFLADLGYGIFSGNKKSSSVIKYVSEGILFLVITFVAHYLAVAFYVYNEGLCESFSSAIRLMPDFLEIPEVFDAFIEDLVFAYIFGVVFLISNIVSNRKNRNAV